MLVLENKSKVLMRGIKLSGGAPKSTFQYLEILKKKGCNITVIAQESEQQIEEMYEESFDELILTQDFREYYYKHDLWGLYNQIKTEYRMLKANRPDLAILLGHFNAPFYAPLCNSLEIPNITIIAGGDLSKGLVNLRGCPTDHFICFSEENRDVLLEYFESEKITVIPNRIKLKEVFDDSDEHYYFEKDDKVNILLTSRITDNKYDSVINFIKIVRQIQTDKYGISLSIAGDGDCLEKLKKYVSDIDTDNLEIHILGHINDLTPEFRKAHIVVGKGRSIIEPVMMNRIGCVIGDDGKIEVCSSDNFERLYHYNFSGRNLMCEDSEEVLQSVIDTITNPQYNNSANEEVVELLRQYYSAEYLEEKICGVLETFTPMKRKSRYVSVCWLILKLILNTKQNKAKKGNNQ